MSAYRITVQPQSDRFGDSGLWRFEVSFRAETVASGSNFADELSARAVAESYTRDHVRRLSATVTYDYDPENDAVVVR